MCVCHIYLFVVSRLAQERDAVERESREKETKILSLSRQLEAVKHELEEAGRVKQQQQSELDDLMSSKDDVGKNVSTFCPPTQQLSVASSLLDIFSSFPSL